MPTAAAGGPKVNFGGQYRVNAYTSDNDSVSENDNQTAARVYAGQTTNFHTPGGGYAPVFVVPDEMPE